MKDEPPIAMTARLLIEPALTLRTVNVACELVAVGNPTPLGYTWGLLAFILPVSALGWWFLRHDGIWMSKEEPFGSRSPFLRGQT